MRGFLEAQEVRPQYTKLARHCVSLCVVWIETGLVEKFWYMFRKTYQPNFCHQKSWPQKAFLQNWLLSCSYYPSKSNIVSHLEHLRRSLDLYPVNYDNLLLMGDFNLNTSELNMKGFCGSYGFKSLIKVSTCFKNPENPSCIDLILTNHPLSF